MVQIPLKHGQVLLIDEIDIPLVNRYKWYAYKTERGGCYAYANAFTSDGKNTAVLLHRLIASAQRGQEVDHRDGNGLNNTRENLRTATTSQNQCNRGPQRNNTSGYKGVRRHKNRWQALIKLHRKDRYLGSFKTKEEAAKAYDRAARDLHGDFAWTNFPDTTEGEA